MKRRDFVNSIVGESHVLWYDRDEIIDIIRQTFAFADRLTKMDNDVITHMRRLQKAGIRSDELVRLEKKVDEILKKRKEYYEFGQKLSGKG